MKAKAGGAGKVAGAPPAAEGSGGGEARAAAVTGGKPAPKGTATARLNLSAGWWGLLLFLTLGLALESLHGLKVRFYLDAQNSLRRELWTLAHAHGTLLSVINIVFGLTWARIAAEGTARGAFASRCLLAALVLLPAGFFLGGLYIYAGDPGLGIVLVPIGGLLLLLGVLFTVLRVRRL